MARLPQCPVTTRLSGSGWRQPEGGYTSMLEIICCYCGNHLDRGYPEFPPGFQRKRIAELALVYRPAGGSRRRPPGTSRTALTE